MNREQIKKAFNQILDIDPREADYQVLEMLGPTVENVADYIWDHWLGEPESPSLEDIEATIVKEVTNGEM